MSETKIEKESNAISMDFKSDLAPSISETFDAIIDSYPESSEVSEEEITILNKAIEKLGKWIIESYKEHKKFSVEFDG